MRENPFTPIFFIPGFYMAARIKVLEKQSPSDLKQAFEKDVIAGLSAAEKRIPSRYFYDDEGSRIFQEIMDLPEYYPTDCEHEILAANAGRISGIMGADQPFRLVELGAGDGRKTRLLLDRFTGDDLGFEYVPIDISEGAMGEMIDSVVRDYPEMNATGLVCEYNHGLSFLKADQKRNLVLFLGSSIGNFTFEQAHRFCRGLRDILNPGDYLLIGFDLRKEMDVLIPAYSDSRGVTARFNLNLLERINRELGADFDLQQFSHFATYNVHSGAMESYLLSRVKQTVRIKHLDREFDFDPWEPLHTEYSWKYLSADVEDLARSNDFQTVGMFYDERRYFLNALWRI
ncbi:MAG: L-histidine N(alpha)-methyltransferase [Leptospirales bacterium]